VIYLLALALGVRMRWSVDALALVVVTVMLGSAIFATFSLIAACLVKTRERFMGIGQVLTMPLFFASNAIYPLDMMPQWLRSIAAANPLTYQVDALRALMIDGGTSVFGLGTDFAVQAAVLALLTLIATRLYPTIVN
jgi:ABC-2 type transport system permease protein